MHLSQLVLKLMDKKTMRALSDVYLLHQLVMSGFSDYKTAPRILFRVEPEVNVGMLRILVQSEVKPLWLLEESTDKGIVSVQIKEFNHSFRAGALYRFRLRANPVITREGRRYGLIRDERLIDWLKAKEERLGANFHSVMAVDEGYSTGIKKKGERTDRINIKLARFEGVLAVNDPERFTAGVYNGIGPAKAFGCGLISLARA